MITWIGKRLASESGYTLAELLVGMVVSAVVLGAAGLMFDASLKTNQRTIGRTDTINAARVSVESISRSLRTAVMPSQLADANSSEVAFLIGEANKVQFYANINNPDNTVGPSRVTYSVTGGTLTQVIQTPNAHASDDHNYQYCDVTLPSCTTDQTTVLSTGVQTSSPVFKFYDQDGAPLIATTTCSDGQPCLSGGDLSNVDSMDVQVSVASPFGSSIAASTYVLRVAMPNHDSIPEGDNS